MIKFTATAGDGRTLIGLGLSEGNLTKLREGKPIKIRLEDLNLGWSGDVLIFWGATEYDMTEQLGGLIGPDTQIRPS